MPVRSLNSLVLKWPDKEEVMKGLQKWIEDLTRKRKDILKIGVFGSYARGDFGFGSDLDIIMILEESRLPFEQRSVEFDTTLLPVPVDLIIYTKREWEKIREENSPFYRCIDRDIVWIFNKG